MNFLTSVKWQATKLLPFLLLLSSCMPPDRKKNAIKNLVELNGVRLPERLIQKLRIETGRYYQAFMHINEIYPPIKPGKRFDINDISYDTVKNGIFFAKVKESRAKEIYSQYYDSIRNTGNFIFLTNVDFAKDSQTYFDVVVVRADDMYDILKLMNTSGPNYDIDNAAVISKMKQWDEEVGFRLVVADEDRIEATMDHLPDDVKKFAKDVYKFCPDVIDQGYGTMDKMLDDYQTNKYFWMWWD
jgi:hypothetical protein